MPESGEGPKPTSSKFEGTIQQMLENLARNNQDPEGYEDRKAAREARAVPANLHKSPVAGKSKQKAEGERPPDRFTPD